MAKRSIIDSNGELEEPKTVALCLLKNVNLTTTGKVTGRVYTFNGAGSVIYDVDEKDAEFLLSRKSVSCCTGDTASPYFEVVRY